MSQKVKPHELAWKSAFQKGSKQLQSRLAKIHANNPEFLNFVKKHGFGATLSMKQAEKQKTSSVVSVPPLAKIGSDAKKSDIDRENLIKQTVEKVKARKQASSNRVAFGGELGGGFVMPRSGFRRYSESWTAASSMHKANDLKKVNESAKKAKKPMRTIKDPPQLPGPKGGFPIPKGFIRVKDPWGFNVLKRIKEHLNHKLDELKPVIAESVANRARYFSHDSAILPGKLPSLTTPLPKSRKMTYDKELPFDPDPIKKNPGVVVGKNPVGYSRARHLARMGLRKMLAKKVTTENSKMSNKKSLNELKKSTLASYIQKSAENLPTKTSLATDFSNSMSAADREARKHAKKIEKSRGTDADAYVAWRKAKERSDGNAYWAAKFGKEAKLRLRGIKLASTKLAKEGVVIDAGLSDKGTGLKAKKSVSNIDAAKRSQAQFDKKMASKSVYNKKTGNYDPVKEETIEEGKNPYGPGYKLVDKEGKQLHVGHKFKDEDGEHHEVTGWQSGAQRGNFSSSGRVAVKVGKGKDAYHTEYFPHVFDFKVVKEEISPIVTKAKALYNEKRQALDFSPKEETVVVERLTNEMAEAIDNDVVNTYMSIREAGVRRAMLETKAVSRSSKHG